MVFILLLLFILSPTHTTLLGFYKNLDPPLIPPPSSQPLSSLPNITQIPFSISSPLSPPGFLTLFSWPIELQQRFFYSIYWSGIMTTNFSGNFTFDAGSDDGVKVIIDGLVIIDFWGPRPYTINTGIISLLSSKQYFLEIYYYQGVAAATFTITVSPPTCCNFPNGLTGLVSYYDPILEASDFLLIRNDSVINFTQYDTPFNDVPLLVRWVGKIIPLHKIGTIEYNFTISYAEGMRFMINGNPILDYFLKYHPLYPAVGTVNYNFTAGQEYDIILDYHSWTSVNPIIILEWSYGTNQAVVVPGQAFQYSPSTCGPPPAGIITYCEDGKWVIMQYNASDIVLNSMTNVTRNGSINVSSLVIMEGCTFTVVGNLYNQQMTVNQATLLVNGDLEIQNTSLSSSQLSVNGNLYLSNTLTISGNTCLNVTGCVSVGGNLIVNGPQKKEWLLFSAGSVNGTFSGIHSPEYVDSCHYAKTTMVQTNSEVSCYFSIVNSCTGETATWIWVVVWIAVTAFILSIIITIKYIYYKKKTLAKRLGKLKSNMSHTEAETAETEPTKVSN